MTREQILAMTDEELANLVLDKVAQGLVVDDVLNEFSRTETNEEGEIVDVVIDTVRNPVPLVGEIWLGDLCLSMPDSNDDITGFECPIFIGIDDDDKEMVEKIESLAANRIVSANKVEGESAKKVDETDVLLRLKGGMIEMRIVNPDALRLPGEKNYETKNIDGRLVDAGFVS